MQSVGKLLPLLEVGAKSDGALLGLWIAHQGTDGLIDLIELPPGLQVQRDQGPLEDGELVGEVLLRGQDLAQIHQGAHDVDGQLGGARTVQDGAVLSEDEWDRATGCPLGYSCSII